MKKILNLFCLVFIITAISCEDYNSNTKTMDITNSKVNIKNGRLYFPTKSIFKEYMSKYIDASETELSKFFDPLYKEGFYSLRPIVTQENERLLYNNYIKLKPENPLKNTSKTTDDYFDQIEEIIGDDVFAAFLNEKGEIQIEDIIYKYTHVGLFFAKEDKLDDLKNFLEVRNISEDLRYETPINSKQAIKTEFPLEGTTVINPDISYFKILYVDPNDQGGGGPPSYNPTQNGPISSNPSYNVFLNNLQYCEPSHGLFGNLFGDNYVCIDRYENRRRVKTKAFNYNYLIVYHMGVKVHHQYRGWTGFWRTEAINEIRLVVEAAQFEYDTQKLLNNALINNARAERAYYKDSQKILYQPNTMTLPGQWGTPNVTYTDLNSLPQVFQNSGGGLTFEFFSTGWDYLDNQIQNGIDSNAKASALNDYFYNALYDTAKSQIQNAINNYSYNPPSNRTFPAKFPENGKIIVQKSVVDIGYGNGIAQQTFDWGAEFRLNFSDNGQGDWSISGGGAGNQLIRPSNFRVKIIGAAFGDSWHGSKFNVGIN